MTEEGPKRISDREIELSLTGFLVLWDPETDQPLLLSMPGCDDHWVACFSTVEKRDSFGRDYDIRVAACKQITDGREFLSSLLGKVRVALDPYKNDAGRMRFIEPVAFAGGGSS